MNSLTIMKEAQNGNEKERGEYGRFQTSLLNEDGGKSRKMLGFAHREVARKKVKCLLFHSIIVK